MRLVRLYARHSGQSGAGAVAHCDGIYNDYIHAGGFDNNWVDNEWLGNCLDDHHFRDYNQRINNDWFDDERDDDKRNNFDWIDRYDSDRLDLQRRNASCEHLDRRPGSTV